MIKVHLITVGNLKEKYLKDAISEYSKRLHAFIDFDIVELKESNKEAEGKSLKKYLRGYNVALTLNEEMLTSREFANKIDKITTNLSSEISFFIGGSDGLSDEILNEMDYLLTFSKMTFPHQLFRVIFVEQLYRAFTILNGKTYHK